MRFVVQASASLQALNSFGVAARARQLATLQCPAQIDAALEYLAAAQRTLLLGGGTNLLLASDFDGAVLRMALRGRRIVSEHPERGVVVEAAAGESWHDFVCWTLEQGLSGLENLSLIPGTVGASPIQNIGAYGVEMRDCFDSLEAVHRQTGERCRLAAADCRFGYRDSLFKHADGASWLILSVRFRLWRHFVPRLEYAGLRAALAGSQAIAAGAPLDARRVAAAVIAIRRSKLPDPARLGNAGSFFRNPLVPASQAAALGHAHPALPCYPAEPGTPPGADGLPQRKLSAGWLIDQCGWKGYRDGDAGVHAQHALVLVNHGAATGAQLLALAGQIRESVRERFGVTLEPEPTIIR